MALCRSVDDSADKPSDSASQEQPSTSGRSDKEGVFVVFTDGEIALDGFYQNGRRNVVLGQPGRVLASSCHRGKLVVASSEDNSTCIIAMYCLQVSLDCATVKQFNADA